MVAVRVSTIFSWLLVASTGASMMNKNLRRNPSISRRLDDKAWTTITYDDFESGWGSFTEVRRSRDASRTNKQSCKGSYSLRIRDNSGDDSSVFHTSNHDVSAFADLRVSFQFYALSMESNEDFFLEYGKQDLREGEFVEAVEVPLPKAGTINAGYKISNIEDVTPIPHNGCRPPKKRRV